MIEITVIDLAVRMAALKYGEQLTFFSTEEGDSYGAIRIKVFEADMVIINYYGGGCPYVIDTEWMPDKDVTPAILHGLNQYLGYCDVDRVYIHEPDYPRHDPAKLLSQQELIRRLEDDGGHDRALSHIREHYAETLGCDPIWRYPISLDSCNGGFLIPVTEGYLFIPYDEVDTEDYEILMLDKTRLMDEESCDYFVEELQSYGTALCQELQEICKELTARTRAEARHI